MLQVLRTIVRTVVSCFQTHRSLALENLALRHQLLVLKRSATKRSKISASDRVLWGWLSRVWSDWQKVLVMVKPETVIAWHRRGFRWLWSRKSRRGSGRPPVDKDIVELIRTMSDANPLWGAPRIPGELRKIGIYVAQSTVEKCMTKRRKPPCQTWRTFLDNQAKDLASIDFFTVPTATFRVLFVMLILSHDRRRVVHFNVTANPSATWTAQQVVNAFPWDTAPKYMIRDRDSIYAPVFRSRVKHLGVKSVVTARKSPWQNPFVERLIGSVRRDCLDYDHVINERHLMRVLKSYFEHYHSSRTHFGLEKDCPEPRAVEGPEVGKVIAMPKVGGLHHRYTRIAA